MASTPRKKDPGPKPDFQVVEHSLHCQTDEGEIVLDLRIPIVKLELLMDTFQEEDAEKKISDHKLPRFMLDHILSDEDKATIEGMRDGAKGYGILMRYLNVVSERLGVGLGESSSSTDSSESTEQPSEPTSAPATA